VNAIEWYHTLELPHGIVTPGFVDHRKQVKYYGLPDDMTGMRALDVATFDGYWAFEMERRGAEVIAVDIGRWFDADIPARWRQWMGPEMDVVTGSGFRLAKEVLGSKVERREISVYDLSPEVLGKFDVVIISDLLQHLRDPQRALEQTYTVVRDAGCLIVAEVFNEELERHGEVPLSQFTAFVGFAWWMANTAALKLMLNVAGFYPVEEVSRFPLEHVKKIEANKVVLKGYPWQAKRGEG
jgi:tRNA (mo5U34)-methyltransferase